MLEQTLKGFTQMLTATYIQDCRIQVVNLVQIALQSAFSGFKENTSDNQWQKVEIVRN